MANKKADLLIKATQKADAKKETNKRQSLSLEELKNQAQKRVKRTFLPKDTMIQVFNNVSGTLVWVNKRNNTSFILEGYGATDFMSVEEIYQLKNSPEKSLLLRGQLMILDDELVKEMGLTKLYETLFNEEELINIFQSLSGDAILELLKSISIDSAYLICQRAVALAREKDSLLDSSEVRDAFIKFTNKDDLFDFADFDFESDEK